MKSRTDLLRAAAFWATAFLLAPGTLSSAKAGTAVGEVFPDLGKFQLEGALPKTAGKVVLVDFWASWCGPCRKSFPVYDQLTKTYGPKGFVVVAVSVDEDPDAYRKFLAKHKPGFATVLDASQALAKKVQPATMPTSFLIDRKGRVRFIHAGFHGKKTQAAYEKEIAALLAES